MTRERFSISVEEFNALIAARDERDALRSERDELRGELRVTKIERDLVKEQLQVMIRRLFGAKSRRLRIYPPKSRSAAIAACSGCSGLDRI